MTDDRVGALATALDEARARFFDTFDALPADRRAAQTLVGDWGARELIAHLGYWAGHSLEAIHRVELGETDALDVDGPQVDAINDTVARVARETPLPTVRSREAAAAEALIVRLGAMDPGLLSVVLPDGGTLERQLQIDGPEHYREHTEQLLPR
jgi:hypothetical protein